MVYTKLEKTTIVKLTCLPPFILYSLFGWIVSGGYVFHCTVCTLVCSVFARGRSVHTYIDSQTRWIVQYLLVSKLIYLIHKRNHNHLSPMIHITILKIVCFMHAMCYDIYSVHSTITIRIAIRDKDSAKNFDDWVQIEGSLFRKYN